MENKMTDKEIGIKIKDLKIELLKQTLKRKGIKKEIARLFTLKPKKGSELSEEEINKLENKTKK